MDTYLSDFPVEFETPELRELREEVVRREQRLAELDAEIREMRRISRERDCEARRLMRNLRANPGDRAAMMEMQAHCRQVTIELATDPKGMAEALDRFEAGLKRHVDS